MNKKNLFIWFSLLVFAAACSKSFDDIDEYKAYVKGEISPYRQVIERNGVKVILNYLPAEAVMANEIKIALEKIDELKQGSNTDNKLKIEELKTKLKESKKNYDKSFYFLLNLSYTDPEKDIVYEKLKSGRSEYSKWLEKLLFDLKKTIKIESSDGMEIPLTLYHFDRTFEMQRDRSFLLAFSKTFNEKTIDVENNEWIKIKIKEFGLKTGSLSFKYNLPLDKVMLSY